MRFAAGQQNGDQAPFSICECMNLRVTPSARTAAAGGRIGWLPFQQLLVFVSGGYTEARFDAVNFRSASLGVPTTASIGRHTYSGWFLGTGYDYGIGWLPGLFWKTEYRFADYGSDRLPWLAAGVPSPGEFLDVDKRVHTVRSELVWRFNFGGPVVARY